MNNFPGSGSFPVTGMPTNMISPEFLNLSGADGGSLPSGATSGQLANLVSEEPSATYNVGDAGVSSPDFTTLRFEVDLGSDIWSVFGAAIFFQTGFSERSNPVNFHRVRALKGLYKVGPQETGGIPSTIVLDEYSGLINENYGTAVITGISEKNIHIGVKVGTHSKGFNYPKVLDGICVAGNADLIGKQGWKCYKSMDGRYWTEVKKSALSKNGYSSGERYYSTFRNASPMVGRIILFAEPERANYFKVVLESGASSGQVSEIVPLNLTGEINGSADFENWTMGRPDTDAEGVSIVRFFEPTVEQRPRLNSVPVSVQSSVVAANKSAPNLSAQQRATLEAILGKGAWTENEFSLLRSLLGTEVSNGEARLLRRVGASLGIQPSTAGTTALSRSQYDPSVADVGLQPIAQAGLTEEEAAQIGASGMAGAIIEFRLQPWTAASGRDAEVEVSHVEIYNRADETDFGENGNTLVFRLAGALPGETPTDSDARTVYIVNSSKEYAKSLKVKIPLIVHEVTQTFASSLTTPLVLADSSRRITAVKALVNADHDGLGSYGDDDITINATGTALVTEVGVAPTGSGEYQLQHEDGEIITFTATNGSESITFAYADEGCWATEISFDGSTWYKAGTEITQDGDFAPGEKVPIQVRSNQELYSTNRERSAPILARFVREGNTEDILAARV